MKAMLLALLLVPLAAQAAEPPAKELFGGQAVPSAGVPRVFGSYAKGCLAGAASLPANGDGYQAMRLSRNRMWGHPDLVALIERLAVAARQDGWPGLLVGDMSQPRGGPMRTGHASHQIGLDVDLWLTPMPDRDLSAGERETLGAVSMLEPGTRRVDPAVFGSPQVAVIRRAALEPEVARIFVHPGIKQALCQAAGTERDWLRKVRPWWGHDAHFHVRLACPAGQADCQPQEPPPPGDGCGEELEWWLGDEPWARPALPAPPPPPLRLADLPASCAPLVESR
ncbi:penicillin-insensitive murein endopeptidase [Geminicoccus roseus]|uniref:penicillin-insensitive murein endopeptidase n=1 Tax=Geminicoccus roseus TaxID=404900 RepID=UPI000429D07F|nr:penicillin-insensitive murein endopeptidase [Geminicoccus roseus]